MNNNIAKIRKQRGITQKELAEMVGVGNDWICDIEKGNGKPSMKVLEKIAEQLNVSLSEIFLD